MCEKNKVIISLLLWGQSRSSSSRASFPSSMNSESCCVPCWRNMINTICSERGSCRFFRDQLQLSARPTVRVCCCGRRTTASEAAANARVWCLIFLSIFTCLVLSYLNALSQNRPYPHKTALVVRCKFFFLKKGKTKVVSRPPLFYLLLGEKHSAETVGDKCS